jgi:hypothetical protein
MIRTAMNANKGARPKGNGDRRGGDALQVGFLGCLGVLAAVVAVIVFVAIIGVAVIVVGSKQAGTAVPGPPVFVEITGYDPEGLRTPGAFTGSIVSDGNSQSVSGQVPQSYQLWGSGPFTAVIQKGEGYGDTLVLQVELINCPDGLRHVGETDAPDGVVTVTCD